MELIIVLLPLPDVIFYIFQSILHFLWLATSFPIFDLKLYANLLSLTLRLKGGQAPTQ